MAVFVLELVRNINCWFSEAKAYMLIYTCLMINSDFSIAWNSSLCKKNTFVDKNHFVGSM